jgi:small-conductance mechanosensitive channel
MQYIIGIIVALVGVIVYQMNKRKSAEVDAILANTKGQDKQLEVKETEIKEEISVIDARLEEIKKARAEQLKIQDQMDLAQRAEELNKKLGGK